VSLFTELKRELEHYLDNDKVEYIYNAYRFAAQAHKGQQRHSGDPYITHPLAVARILAEMSMDPATITAAILHDVIEDTGVEKAELADLFSLEVAELVDGVSKLKQIQSRSRLEAQAENFRKMLLAMAKDIRVILIKLADRLHNMRTLGVVPAEKRRRIAIETLEIYAPIAHRLGMHAFRIEFEDLGFAALYPMRHRILQESVRKGKRGRKTIISHIENALKECLEKHKIPPSVVWAKPKHLYSVYKDMKEKHASFNEIMDNYTFCIVVDSIDTCYRVLGAVHSLYKPLPDRFYDYIALPKANGYQALHTRLFGPYALPIAIQIRTVDMDNVADSGIATHWLVNSPQQADSPAHIRAGEWLKRLLDIQRSTGNAIEFIENVKIDLFPDEVYVFTPKGEIFELPRGSTAIDFAYAVHSDVGNHCISVHIDRKPAPLSSVLINGQTIEILTDNEAKPNPTWLNFVTTGKARSNIRHFLKDQHRTEAITFGQHLLEAALTNLNIALKDILPEKLSAVLLQLEYKNEQDLWAAIGLGHHLAPTIARYLTETNNGVSDELQEHVTAATTPLLIKGTEGMLVNFAECCRPIPGDPIIGILKAGTGITVHIAQCKKATRLAQQSDRCLPVTWSDAIQGDFKVDIRIEVNNQRGVLAQLAGAVAAANANIHNISVEDHEGRDCIVNLTLSLRNRAHLAHVIRRLRILKSVMRIMRYKKEKNK
jgi:RelA/SpoT family (p)ppGpp synthetase